MSGSPPLPPKPTPEAGERSQGSYQSTSHDVYRGASTTTPPHGADILLHSGSTRVYSHPHARHQPPPTSLSPSQSILSGHTRPYPSEPQDRFPYPHYGRSDDSFLPQSLSSGPPHPPVSQGPGQTMSGYPSYLPSLPGPASMQQGYSASPRPPAVEVSSPVAGPSGNSDTVPPYASPKAQRKTKGHVASACVPCKRAHLRCDAQRPCSRCLSNGKEDACVDVQHKKRGRPRLREERDLRYEFSGRSSPGGHPAEASMRGPLPVLYGPPSTSIGSGYGLSSRRGRSASYRVLKSQPADSMVPRYIERGSAADANIYPALSISTRAPEPAAFLTTDLEIANASHTFADAVGRQTVKGLTLLDIVPATERERVLHLQRQMQEERERKDPQYLPPIFVKRDEARVIQSLGFSPEDLSRYALDWQEFLTFNAVDGQQRTFPVRMGFAKQDSIYYIVLLLHVAVRPLGHPTPSPHSRDLPYSYQSLQQPQQHQQLYSQPTPVSATFEAGRPRMASDAGLVPHRPTPPSGPSPMYSGLSPSISSAYGPSPGRSDYSAGPPAYQTPRSELPAGPLPHRQPQQPAGGGYHLPPIRNQQDSRYLEGSATSRDEKSRVDIGGLIDRPEPSRTMP